MPYVQLKLFGTKPTPGTVTQLQRGLTDLMATVLKKKRPLTVVEIEIATNSLLSGGAEPLSPGQWSGRLMAFVTAGTNNADEKAAFLKAAHQLLIGQFGPAATPLYLIVQELPGDAWGYDGLSQAARARAAVPA